MEGQASRISHLAQLGEAASGPPERPELGGLPVGFVSHESERLGPAALHRQQ